MGGRGGRSSIGDCGTGPTECLRAGSCGCGDRGVRSVGFPGPSSRRWLGPPISCSRPPPPSPRHGGRGSPLGPGRSPPPDPGCAGRRACPAGGWWPGAWQDRSSLRGPPREAGSCLHVHRRRAGARAHQQGAGPVSPGGRRVQLEERGPICAREPEPVGRERPLLQARSLRRQGHAPGPVDGLSLRVGPAPRRRRPVRPPVQGGVTPRTSRTRPSSGPRKGWPGRTLR